MMVSALTPNPEHLDWLRDHGIDPDVTVSPIQVTPAPTREEPRRVLIDYVTVHRDDSGEYRGRKPCQIFASEPPPSAWLSPPAADDDELTTLRTKVALVEAALANHPKACDHHPDGDVVSCGWKRAVLDVQAALAEPVTTEGPWHRLYRVVQDRRHELGLTLADIQTAGGPSPRWVQKLRLLDGPPTDRMRLPMRRLDQALGWPHDTTWRLACGATVEP